MKSAMAFFIPLLVGIVGACSPTPSQETPPPIRHPQALLSYQDFVQETVSGERAREMVAFMDPSYRIPGNASYNAALEEVVRVLREAGYSPETAQTGSRLTYRLEALEMDRPAWDPVSASLTLVGRTDPLMTLSSNINLLAAYSHSTPEGGLEAELVDVGPGSPADFEGLDVRGKVVLGDGNTGQLFRRAVQEHGALGVLSFQLSTFNRPEVNRGIARMSSIPYDPDARAWGLALSRDARDELREALISGPTRVRVEAESRIYPSEELTLIAEVEGEMEPDERFVFSSHVQESGANDNATGVAALAEVARTLGEGVRAEAFSPGRTITMIWGDEISSTRRYMEGDPNRASGVRWGLSLDMVGEDTEKTGGTFLIEKMPDPSAVWTRGDDKHTEWGSRPMTVDQMTPHYFNDFLLNRCLDQAEGTGWVVGTNPYEGGSDHVPFLRAGVPGVLFWHFTDQFYHTDGDRLEMVSAGTLENVTVCATVSAIALTTADSEMVEFVAKELERAARFRIEKEATLSSAALASGGNREEERLILQTWTDWYLDAVDALRDMEAGGATSETEAILESARASVADAGRKALEKLGG